MLTRAIITALDLDRNKVQVRMPLFEGNYKRGTIPQLDSYVTNWASIMYLPGLEVDYRVGDVVIVGFEDNNIGKPLVLGFLKLTGNNSEESRLYGKFIESITGEKFVAPVTSTIGEVTYEDLYNKVLGTGTGGGSVYIHNLQIQGTSGANNVTLALSSIISSIEDEITSETLKTHVGEVGNIPFTVLEDNVQLVYNDESVSQSSIRIYGDEIQVYSPTSYQWIEYTNFFDEGSLVWRDVVTPLGGGVTGVTVDTVLSDTSTNPVENRVVTKALQDAMEVSIGDKQPTGSKVLWINPD